MYPQIELPFDFLPFEIMNKIEADRFFKWFIEIQHERIQILNEYCRRNDGDYINLDFTPESLNSLWNWFNPRMKLIKRDNEVLEEEEQTLLLGGTVTVKNEYKFCKETETIILDIGLYFGKVFLHKFNQLKWDVVYRPRSFIDVNRPIITGFAKNINLNPIRVINTYATKEVKGTQKISLLDLFYIWTKYLK